MVNWLNIAFILSALIISDALNSQITYECEDGQLKAEVPSLMNAESTDSLLQELGTTLNKLDSLTQIMEAPKTNMGWIYKGLIDGNYSFEKRMIDLEYGESLDKLIVTDSELDHKIPYYLDVPYGFNKLKNNYKYDFETNEVQFVLESYLKANNVLISGTFNNWSISETRMNNEDGVWKITLELPPGKHLYKFIVDGEWLLDPNNSLKEHDGYGNTNSVYYAYNHEFALKGFKDAKRVYVAGSFNDWYEKGLEMRQKGDEWRRPMYLRNGAHSYKFKVGRDWVLDPENESTQPNGLGDFNSLLIKGPKVEVNLNAFESAQSVFIAGDFNAWNPAEIEMKKSKEGWSIEYALSPGNYEYKFVVDGVWKLDPTNSLTKGQGDYENSVLIVNPNHTFRLKDPLDAEEVILTGEFLGWTEAGYKMKKTAFGWEMPMHLKQGKVLYKFIVDGKWVEDKGNPLWEMNDLESKNSVLWID